MLQSSLLVKNIRQLVTLAPLAERQKTTFITHEDLGILRDGWLLIDHKGSITAAGEGQPPAHYVDNAATLDAEGALVLPGLVDSHAHVIWAGSRAEEFDRRLRGETYQSIAASGGGIASTVRATRAASDGELLRLCIARARRFLACGITTFETKSGYGLSLDHELRLLKILNQMRSRIPQQVAITCLALHGASPEHPDLDAWVKECTAELLPIVANQGLADAVDAFIDEGYFSAAQVEPYLALAQSLGLKIRLHADEFSDAAAASLAARYHATSADHLQWASPAGVEAMAQNGVTATLLPGTSLYTKLPFTSGRRLADAGVPIALATDFNPGSCLIDNLPMLATVACIHAGLTPAEAIAGITYVPARSLGLGDRKGALAIGYDADFVLYRGVPSLAEWIADFGRTPPSEVWIKGKKALG